MKTISVIDSHLHVVDPSIAYRDDVSALITDSSKHLGTPFSQIGEPLYRTVMAEASVDVKAAVFVEVLPVATDSLKEACWVLREHVGRPEASCIRAVVASVPVTNGAEAVSAWLETLNSVDIDAQLARKLRGARMQFPKGDAGDAVLRSEEFAAGLAELGRRSLHFEFCVHADRLPAVIDATRRCPAVRVVLDHCGLNNSGMDFDAWRQNITALAACDNAVIKLSAIEEWRPIDGDPGPYLDHALSSFGPERCMFGGNWFVPVVFGKPVRATVDLVSAALDRAGASEEYRAQVFMGNAARFYGIDVD
jgi:predicted TIM-barrel fold metal-dependent hydrolase